MCSCCLNEKDNRQRNNKTSYAGSREFSGSNILGASSRRRTMAAAPTTVSGGIFLKGANHALPGTMSNGREGEAAGQRRVAGPIGGSASLSLPAPRSMVAHSVDTKQLSWPCVCIVAPGSAARAHQFYWRPSENSKGTMESLRAGVPPPPPATPQQVSRVFVRDCCAPALSPPMTQRAGRLTGGAPADWPGVCRRQLARGLHKRIAAIAAACSARLDGPPKVFSIAAI